MCKNGACEDKRVSNVSHRSIVRHRLILRGVGLEKVFFAYPGNPPVIGQAVDWVKSSPDSSFHFKDWKDVDNWGKDLIQPILEEISASDTVVADITKLNPNVAFEVGYSIASGKKVLLVINSSVENDSEEFRKIGIYDTLGHRVYSEGYALRKLVSSAENISPYSVPERVKKTRTPVYIVETPERAAGISKVISWTKEARLRFHSFNPRENARLAGPIAIQSVVDSDGSICPLLNADTDEARHHNIRSAFVAGVSYGLKKPTFIYWIDNETSPLDVRDIGFFLSREEDLKDQILKFFGLVWESRDGSVASATRVLSRLEELNLGDPTAENEFTTLGSYYVPTDEYQRARRGEVNLIVGRKGSGKTALMSQVRDKVRSSRSNIVVDLLPDGYQLVRLKEDIIDHLEDGAALHLISTYWQYILYSEIAFKVLEKDRVVHTRNKSLAEAYRELDKVYNNYEFVSGEGDFSERMTSVAVKMADAFRLKTEKSDNKLRLSAPEVTEFMHSEQIGDLRGSLINYLRRKDEVWVLFDNLDKGWKSFGLSDHDVFILRSLLDASRKVTKALQRARVPYRGILFVRNDVYQLMVREDPDFGKESRAALDWTDRSQLRTMIIERMRVGLSMPIGAEEEDVANSILDPIAGGKDSIDYMIDHCLMRPRALLKILAYARSSAVNKGLVRISEECIEKAIRMHADDLLIDASNEVRDVTGVEDVFYAFLEHDRLLSNEEIVTALRNDGVKEELMDSVIEAMLYSGVFGLDRGNLGDQYIYDFSYDLKRMDRLRGRSESPMFVVHPGLLPALHST